MVSAVQRGQTAQPALLSLPLRSRQQRLDGVPASTAVSTSPGQLQSPKEPTLSRSAQRQVSTSFLDSVHKQQGYFSKGSEAHLRSSRQQSTLDEKSGLRPYSSLVRETLMPPVLQSPPEPRVWPQCSSQDTADGFKTAGARAPHATSSNAQLEHAGSLRSEWSNGQPALQLLADGLMTSGGSSQADSNALQAWAAAVNAIARQAQHSDNPHAFLAHLASTSSVQSSARVDPAEQQWGEADKRWPCQKDRRQQPQATSRDESHIAGRQDEAGLGSAEDLLPGLSRASDHIQPLCKAESSQQPPLPSLLQHEPRSSTAASVKGSEGKGRSHNFRVYSNTFQNRAGNTPSRSTARAKQVVGRERSSQPDVRLKPAETWLTARGTLSRNSDSQRVQTISPRLSPADTNRSCYHNSISAEDVRKPVSSLSRVPVQPLDSSSTLTEARAGMPNSNAPLAEGGKLAGRGTQPAADSISPISSHPPGASLSQAMQQLSGSAIGSQTMSARDQTELWVRLQAMLHNIASAPKGSSLLASVIPKTSPFSSLEAWRESFLQQSIEGLQMHSAPILQHQSLQSLRPGDMHRLATEVPHIDRHNVNTEGGKGLPASSVHPLQRALYSEATSGTEPNRFAHLRLEKLGASSTASPTVTQATFTPAPKAAAEPKSVIPDPHNPFEVENYRMGLMTAIKTIPPAEAAVKVRPSSPDSPQIAQPPRKLPKLGSTAFSAPPLSVFQEPKFTAQALPRAATVTPSSDMTSRDDPDEQAAETLLSLFEPQAPQPEHQRTEGPQSVRRRRPRSARNRPVISASVTRSAYTTSSDEDARGPPHGQKAVRRRSSDLKRKAATRDAKDEPWVPRKDSR